MKQEHSVFKMIKWNFHLYKILACIACLLFSTFGFGKNICPNLKHSLGQCIKLNGIYIYMESTGLKEKKAPIVVFESGKGNTHDVWNKVVPTVSKFSRVVTYDRANLGYSQKTAHRMNARFIATTPSNLLKKANLPPPYILVGHSNGGIYVQMFARLFPNKTAGIVLVNSASENQTLSDVLPPKSAASYNEANQFMQNRQELRNAPPFPQVPLIAINRVNRHTSR